MKGRGHMTDEHIHNSHTEHEHPHTHGTDAELLIEEELLHEDAHTHLHSHHHSPDEKKRQISRLNRISGHLNYVKRMIEEDVDCADVLVQIAAIRSALNGLGKEIINEHITHCIYHAIEDGDTQAVEEFQRAIQKFM